MSLNTAMLWLAILAFVPSAISNPVSRRQEDAKSECDREALVKAADAYVEAQTAGSLDPLDDFLSATWTFEENNVEIDAADSVTATKALKIDNRRTIYDLVNCATFTELISPSGADPYVIGTQIRHDTETMKITYIDSIASTTGSWLFNPAKTLQYAQGEDWFEIPEADRDDRAFIQAAGDAYLDMWSNGTARQAVPWGTPCTRLEGGSYTGRGTPSDSCELGVPSNSNQLPNTRRRYVIDESMGSVSILCVWEHMMNAADSHEFRLEGGKLRYIHTMTTCGKQVCRL